MFISSLNFLDRYDLHGPVKFENYAPVTDAEAIAVLMLRKALDIPAIGENQSIAEPLCRYAFELVNP